MFKLIYLYLVSTSRQPSIYKGDLEHPCLDPDLLPQPCSHIFASASMQPVSHTIQEGVRLLVWGHPSNHSWYKQGYERFLSVPGSRTP
ncbi:hypothetical protein EDB87DRAFT_1627826 [Lactarius vividus]|nr:hypothetical protein EDB87DRAFT_1627826 [Lactarius vividus]